MDGICTRLVEEFPNHKDLPEKFQIVIHPMEDEWQYYMVDNTPGYRCIFWLHEHDAADALSEIKGMNSPSHLSKLQTSIWFTN